MIIKSVHVKRFRSLYDQSIDFDSLTALVGRNGSGKSTLLRAIDLFYATSPKVDHRDFYDEDTSKPIEVAIVFSGLRADELERFNKYIEDGQLRVIRILTLAEGKPIHRYHGFRMLNPEFDSVRSAGSAREARANYESLRGSQKYDQLPAWASRDQAFGALGVWEEQHSADCTRMIDDGQFFGFAEVAQGYLGKYTKFILIPAVRDASEEAEEGRGSAITEIMDLVVRSTLASHAELQKLREESKSRYDEIIDPSKLGEMQTLESNLNESLKQYAPDGGVHLAWLTTGGIDIQMPRAEVKLTEDGYRSTVLRTGHGLQRAFLLTMLQYLARARVPAASASVGSGTAVNAPAQETAQAQTESPDLILAIEEPELYQHPSRQRHLATILLQLATGKTAIGDVVQRTQVVYSTHSPAFVGVDRFNQIRLFRKRPGSEGKPKCSSIVGEALDTIARVLWEFHGRPGIQFTGATLKPRLLPLMTPWLNEGFFADVVVLVEGEEDHAAIIGYAKMLGHNFDGSGIAVIPCIGKNNLDRPALIFDALGIPIYLIWDSDEGEADPRPEFNRCLLRIVGASEEDYPHTVQATYACFKKSLTATLKEEIGEETYNEVLSELQDEFKNLRKDCLKNPFIVQELISRSKSRSRSSPTLEKIIDRITKRRAA